MCHISISLIYRSKMVCWRMKNCKLQCFTLRSKVNYVVLVLLDFSDTIQTQQHLFFKNRLWNRKNGMQFYTQWGEMSQAWNVNDARESSRMTFSLDRCASVELISCCNQLTTFLCSNSITLLGRLTFSIWKLTAWHSSISKRQYLIIFSSYSFLVWSGLFTLCVCCAATVEHMVTEK